MKIVGLQGDTNDLTLEVYSVGYRKEETTVKLYSRARYVFCTAFLCSKVGAYHRRITKFYFKSRSKKNNSKVQNRLADASWAAQFKYLYSRLAPPRVVNFCERRLDSRLGLTIGFMDNCGVFKSNNLYGETNNDEPARQN